MTKGSPLLDVKDVWFAYGDGVEVLRGVSLSVSEGEVVALLGPNGTGKTTLLKIVINVLRPLKGKVVINGRDVREYSTSELAKTVAWVPQTEVVTFPFTVREYVLFGRTPHLGLVPVISRHDEEIVESILEELGMSHLSERPVTKLSGGEAQMARIARALAQEPNILLLDEPTSHLDLRNSVRVLQTMVELAKKKNVGILYTTHDPNEAILTADKVYLMSDGKVFQEGRPEDVIRPDNIKRVYGVEVVIQSVNGSYAVVPKPFRRVTQ